MSLRGYARKSKTRVIKEALATFKPQGRFHTLYLAARYPSLGHENWLAKHGHPRSPNLINKFFARLGNLQR